jgi:hypothetical protein
MTSRAIRPTRPAECVIAFAIPTTVAGFVRDLVRVPPKDFAFEYVDREPVGDVGRITRVAEERYVHEVRIIDDVIATARECKAEVVTDLGLGGLGALCEQFSVVMLVAHWKPATFFCDDLLDPIGFIARLREAADPLAAYHRDCLSAEARRLIEEPERFAADRTLACVTLVGELNRILQTNAFGPPLPGATANFRAFRHREHCDLAYSGLISPGNRVEFGDGLHPIEAVVREIPEDFNGILDLAICNSIFLAEEIRRHRRHCRRVLANEEKSMPRFRLLNFKYVLKLLASGGRDYLAAVEELREHLVRVEQKKGAKR